VNQVDSNSKLNEEGAWQELLLKKYLHSKILS
jgi:hypothetical protein